MVDPLIGATENKATVPGAGYTGLALASTRHGDRLFAANFAQGRIDVFNSTFGKVKTARWQFRDPRLPRGYRPFNTQTLNGNIFVAYDKADPATGRQAVGRHLGVVDEFSPNGPCLPHHLRWCAQCPSCIPPSRQPLLTVLARPSHSNTLTPPHLPCGACCPARRPTAAPTRCGSPRASTTSRTACSASCAPNTPPAVSPIPATRGREP